MANLEHAEDDKQGVKKSSEMTTACPQVQPVGLQGLPPCVIPSFADASKLMSAPYSCLVMHTHRKHVALPPMYLQKKRTGIEEELGSELLKFSQSFNGVPLAYENIRIMRQHGDIYDDSGYIHIDIEANFILFQPQKGQKLLGKVNKLGEGHVGCLVHSCFNASIPKPRLVSLQTWLEFGPKIGDELEFDVDALDADIAGVLLIRGRLLSTKSQEIIALGERSESRAPVDQADPESEDIEETPEMVHDSTNTLTKAFKEEEMEVVLPSFPDNDTDTALELNGTNDTNGKDIGGKKKNKKKKEKEVKEEPEDNSPGNSSGYHSDKPSKKRKHDLSTDLNEIDDPPTSKKKKRKSDVN